MPDEAPDLMKGHELAREWQLAPKTLDNWRYRGEGPPFVKLNGAIRYSRKACARWLEERSGGTAA